MSFGVNPRDDGAVEPRLSYTKYHLYDDCQRRWAYQYLRSWFDLDHERDVRDQGSLAPWQTFAGKVVDATITDALLKRKKTGLWPTDLRSTAKSLAQEGWRFSHAWLECIRARKLPPKDDRFQPLDRHYYDEPFRPEEAHLIKDSVFRSIDAFTNSGIPAFIDSFDTKCWRGPRPPGHPIPRLLLGDICVWSSFDFALQTPDLTYIIDWKSGQHSDSAHYKAREQLLWYALYANEVWRVPPARIRVAAAWLASTASLAWNDVLPEELDDLRTRIRLRHAEIHQKTQLRRHPLALDEWPMTDDPRQCERCVFRGTCRESSRAKAEADSLASIERASKTRSRLASRAQRSNRLTVHATVKLGSSGTC